MESILKRIKVQDNDALLNIWWRHISMMILTAKYIEV